MREHRRQQTVDAVGVQGVSSVLHALSSVRHFVCCRASLTRRFERWLGQSLHIVALDNDQVADVGLNALS